MAKVKFYNALGADNIVGAYYHDEALQWSENSTGKKAIYEDPFSPNPDVVFKGTGIKYSEGLMTKGTIEEIVFLSPDDEVMYKISGLHEKASVLSGLMGSQISIDTIINRVLRGNDTIAGSDLVDYMVFGKGNDRINGGEGDDFISGGLGKDILTGGAGSDFFAIGGSKDHDIITDFHADGVEGVQDHLGGSLEQVSLKKQGKHDLLVTYDEAGSSFLLEGVKKAEIDASDFQL